MMFIAAAMAVASQSVAALQLPVPPSPPTQIDDRGFSILPSVSATTTSTRCGPNSLVVEIRELASPISARTASPTRPRARPSPTRVEVSRVAINGRELSPEIVRRMDADVTGMFYHAGTFVTCSDIAFKILIYGFNLDMPWRETPRRVEVTLPFEREAR